MSKWTDRDWWFGRTPEWQARQQAVKGAGDSIAGAGWTLTKWTLGVALFVVFVVATGGLGLLVVPVWWWWRRRQD